MRTTPLRTETGQAEPSPVYSVIELDEITHRFCTGCNDTRAMCGFDARDYDLAEVENDQIKPCPMCESLVDGPCTWCGAL